MGMTGLFAKSWSIEKHDVVSVMSPKSFWGDILRLDMGLPVVLPVVQAIRMKFEKIGQSLGGAQVKQTSATANSDTLRHISIKSKSLQRWIVQAVKKDTENQTHLYFDR